MTSCGKMTCKPHGFTLKETTTYRGRLLEEASSSRCEWIRWNVGGTLLHVDERACPFTTELSIPAEAVCMCLHQTPLYWRRSWLIERLRLWNSRLPAAKYLPYDLMPMNSRDILELSPAAIAMPAAVGTRLRSRQGRQEHPASPFTIGNPTEVRHILPVLQASPTTSAAAWLKESVIETPSVSVLMSIHNMQDTLGWSIRSVLAQTLKGWELLVGDDGSTDGSSLEAMFFDDSRIRLFSYNRNRGKAAVMTRLLQEARGRYIMELDGDDWLSPHALSRLKEALDDNPEAGMATSCCGLWTRTKSFGPVWRGRVDSGGFIEHYSQSLPSDTGAPPLVPRMYRRSALEEVGGWHEREDRFGRIFEDIDLTHRLLSRYPLAQADGILYHRVLYGSSISQQNRELFPVWKWLRS